MTGETPRAGGRTAGRCGRRTRLAVAALVGTPGHQGGDEPRGSPGHRRRSDAHGSTLSRVVHASVLARLDPTQAWQTFREALTTDLGDTQGGTTREGIHLGAMAATIDTITRAFAGAHLDAGTLASTPSYLRRFMGHGSASCTAANGCAWPCTTTRST